MDNRIIIQQCQSGDREAFGSLYRRFGGKMMRIITRYVSDRQSAEDILHDGFVVILTRIGEVRQPDKLEYWMGTIMKNLCLNYLSQICVTDILSENIDIVDDGPDFEDILSCDEIEQLISHLPAGYQRIFRLAVLENKSHKEIGRILGIAPHSSSSQLYHAKVLLRKWITENKHELWAVPVLLMIMGAAWFVADLYWQDEQAMMAHVHTDVDIPAADPEETFTALVE
ncbi:MAG: sigma-70 family RNA polymerase sigma factor, partial [Muribaculaceae bacterium]|nr:sigma-70 family RNA polymerase sigma factor [Muribaculaceae bacterium]